MKRLYIYNKVWRRAVRGWAGARLLALVVLCIANVLPSTAQNKQGEKGEGKPKKEVPYNPKKVLKEVRANMKAEKYAQADNLLSKEMKEHKEAMSSAEFHNYEMNVQHYLAQAENRKIFLKQNPDTAKYFSCIKKVYDYALSCDSLDNLPGVKGKVKPKYASNIAERMTFYRNNMKSAGKFFYKKQKYADALQYLDLFLTTTTHPRIADNKSLRNDPDTLAMMRLAVFSAYETNNFPTVMRYIPYVLDDTLNHVSFCQIGSRSAIAIGDTTTAVQLLNDGWKSAPTNEYFYLAIVQYHIDKLNFASADSIISQQLKVTPNDNRLWYIQGLCKQYLGRDDDALVCFQRTVAIKPDEFDAYLAIGGIYMQRAHDIYESTDYAVGSKNYQKVKQQLQETYSKARDAYETIRKMQPDEPSFWYEPLSEIYYKLNLGNELHELEKQKK